MTYENQNLSREQSIDLIAMAQYVSEIEGLNTYEAFRIITGFDPTICVKCKTGRMLACYLANTG